MQKFNLSFQIYSVCDHWASLAKSNFRFCEEESSCWPQMAASARTDPPPQNLLTALTFNGRHLSTLEPPRWHTMEPVHGHCFCDSSNLFKVFPLALGEPLTLSHTDPAAWRHETVPPWLWPCQICGGLVLPSYSHLIAVLWNMPCFFTTTWRVCIPNTQNRCPLPSLVLFSMPIKQIWRDILLPDAFICFYWVSGHTMIPLFSVTWKFQFALLFPLKIS